MNYETTALTVIFYTLTGAFALAIVWMIVQAYNRIVKTQDAFLEALNDIRMEQIDQNHNIKNNHEHIVRLERVQAGQAEEMADHIVTKLKAAMRH